MPFCTVCSLSVDNKRWMGHLRSNAHKNKNIILYSENVQIIQTAFQNRIASYRITATEEADICLSKFFDNNRLQIKSLIDQSLEVHTCIKVNFELFSMFLLHKNDSQELKSFLTKNFTIHLNYDFDVLFTGVVSSIMKKIEEFQERDSGWTLLNNCHLEVNINKYEPLRGSKFIDLPKFIKNKKACLNIRNDDDFCFLWSITAALYPTKNHPDRVTSYPNFKDILNIKGISFPITFADISVFEKNNPDLSIFVYGLRDGKIITGPLYKSNSKNINANHIHLLLLEHDEFSHYCLIKDLPRLVRNQITNHHGKLHFCENCLIFFSSAQKLEEHVCGGVVTVLPEKGSVIQFKNYDRKQDVPFVIYADFETMLRPVQGCAPDPNIASTSDMHYHVPVAFAYNIVCSVDENYNRFVSYRGEDCVEKFITLLCNDVSAIYKILKKSKAIIFNEQDELNFNASTRCHICNNLLWGDKVRDHCHLTGKYRGAAHSYCNLNYRLPKFVPIFFHNLSGYDCHLFIKQLGELPGTIKIIPKTKENYVSFTKFVRVNEEEYFQLRFVDSFKFLSTSLNKLAQTLTSNDFVHLQKYFPNENQLNLLKRKGVYPYEYITDWKCFEDHQLPPQAKFFSSLSDENISDIDYKHAQSVWSQFHIKNLGEYTDLYVKTDVLLLTDIFEKFRKTCKKHYQLDPAFYLTVPSLSFDAMLLQTGVHLELIDDLAILRMIQKGIRGGVCVCTHRYAKANNKYMSNYDPTQEDSFIVYLDCNNLYGFSMCQSLPLSNFRFLNQQEIDALDITSVADDADEGFILEVDLFYPDNLHRTHNDLPFCPEKCVPIGGKSKKLVPNLYNKYEYVIHYVHLKKCLEHGLILRKIHRVIVFEQSSYLKQYIELNTELRKKADSKFEQDFFKLLNNSVFGKTLENNELRVTVHLVNEWNDKNNTTKKKTGADKLIASPYFHSVSVFTDNLVAIQMKSDRVVLDKPIYTGFSVLELSKAHMYNFHYDVIKPFYKDRCQLCYTDTDSFIYFIKTPDFYQNVKNTFLCHFDTSNYTHDNRFGLPTINKKIPGLFKDEMGGSIVTKFVGLRSKLYCIQTDKRTIKKAKGVKACVVRNLNLTDYQSVNFNENIIRRKNVLFKSIKHQIFTRTINKVALSGNDDKRSVSKDRISTKAWGSSFILPS